MADGNSQGAVQTALYRHFDAGGKLLYVGIALSPTYRLSQHRCASPWFQRIASITVERFPTRSAALHAERQAIQAEKPECNTVHNRPLLPAELGARRDDTHDLLTRRFVTYRPVYPLKDAAKEIGISGAKLRLAAEHGEINVFADGKKQYVTGWSLLAYMEALEAGQVQIRKMPVRNPYGPHGAP